MIYQIVGTYKNKKEVIDEASDISDALYLRRQYEISYGYDWIIETEVKENE